MSNEAMHEKNVPIDVRFSEKGQKATGDKPLPTKHPDLSVFTDTAADEIAGPVDLERVKPEPEQESSLFDATLGSAGRGAQTSIIGTAVRVGMDDGWEAGVDHLTGIAGTQHYVPDADDELALMNSNLPTESYEAVFRGTSTKEQFLNKIQTIEANLALQKESDKHGLTGQIFHGVGDAAGDPLSYVPIGGAALKGGKVINSSIARVMAANAAAAGVSELTLRNQVTGQSADVVGAMAGAAVFSGLLSAGGNYAKHMLGSAENRINASETASAMGQPDPTIRPNPDGKAKVIDNGDGDPIEITESGRVMSAGVVPPKARSQGRFWGKDVATAVMQSGDEAARKLGAMFYTPVQGLKDGYAAARATVETFHRNLQSKDADLSFKLQDTLDELEGRGLFKSNSQLRSDMQRSLYEYINGDLDGSYLPQKLRDIGDAISANLEYKARLLEDPSLLSGVKGASVHTGFVKGKYIWRRYRSDKVSNLKAKYGDEEAQRLVADAWMDDYRNSANRADIDEIIGKTLPEGTEITEEIVAKYAHDKAYGIINNGEDIGGINAQVDDYGGIGGSDFFKHRAPFGNSGKAQAADGTTFEFKELLDYNIENQFRSYSQATNGRISAVAATGKSLDDIDAEIKAIKDPEARKALEETMKTLQGAPRQAYSMADLVSDTLRDATFALSSGMMSVSNMFEITSNMFRKGVMPAVMRNLNRSIKEALGVEVKDLHKLGEADIAREFADNLMGRAATLRIATPFNDYAEGLARRLGTTLEDSSRFQKMMYKARYASAKASEAMPTTSMLNKTQEAIINASNEVGMGEMVSHTFGRGKSYLFSDDFLKTNQISRDVAERAQAFIKEHMSGKPSDTDWSKASIDPRASDVRMMLNAFNDQNIMKTTNLGQTAYKPLGWAGRQLMQFKKFSTVSTQYMVKAGHSIGNGDTQTMLWVLGGAISSAGYMLTSTMTNTLGMSPEERKMYLKDNLSDDKFLAGVLKRHPLLAGPSMMMDMANVVSPVDIPYAGIGKTTAEDMMKPNAKPQKWAGYRPEQHLDRAFREARQMVPAMRHVTNVGKVGVNSAAMAYDSLVDNSALNRMEEQRIIQSTNKAMRQLIPNVPTLRPAYDNIMELFGVEREKYKSRK
ncbi:MAG: hypothetical protein ACRDCE_20355 [Cetobacterium sp.]|uniref:hypothetical protein n=1 Tax=Cetobacterium sp. TaxID=2071632 RepID=UPI003EE6ABED